MMDWRKQKLGSTRVETSGFLRTGLSRILPNHIPITVKLSFAITVLITTGMVMLGAVTASNQTHLLRAQINDFGKAVVEQLAESSKELVLSDDLLGLKVLITNLGNNNSILGAVIYSETGQLLESSGVIPFDDILLLYTKSDLLKNSIYTTEWQIPIKQSKPRPVTSFIAPIRFQGILAGHAVVTFSKESLTQAESDTIRAVLAATSFMIILGIIASFYLSKKIFRPINTLIKASKEIDSGNFDYRIQERRNDELGHLIGAFNSMADGLLEKNQVKNIFSRFVSTNVAQQIMENLDHVTLGGEHVDASVLFADIVGFTSLSEKLPPKEIAALLNEYFTYISMISRLFHGTIDKYIGDCAMVVFGVPIKDNQHRFNAVSCAVMIQKLVERMNVIRVRDGKFTVHFRIGVNSGEMLAGNMGAHERMQYTVVGEAVNLASRLHTTADKGDIIISETMYNDPYIQSRIQAKRNKQIKLRGIADPVVTYIVTDLVSSLRNKMSKKLDDLLNHQYVA